MPDPMNGALILSILRNADGLTMRELSEAFGFTLDGGHPKTQAVTLWKQLLRLRKEGLIEFSVGPLYAAHGKIRVTERWAALQKMLGRPRLDDLAAIGRYGEGLVVQPFFGRPKSGTEIFDIFVLIPFVDDRTKGVFEQIETVVEKKFGKIRVGRAMDIYGGHNVMEMIWQQIWSAKVVIADCTGSNPNVYYELGVAHTVGKPVILVTQDIEKLPFDTRHVNYIPYSVSEEGFEKLSEDLGSALETQFRALVPDAGSHPHRRVRDNQGAIPLQPRVGDRPEAQS